MTTPFIPLSKNELEDSKLKTAFLDPSRDRKPPRTDGPNRTVDVMETPRVSRQELDAFKEIFGYPSETRPGDTADPALAGALLDRMRRREVYDLTRTHERLSDKDFRRTRVEALKQRTGDHYLVQEIGLRVAMTHMDTLEQEGLRIANNNPLSSTYNRSVLGPESERDIETLVRKTLNEDALRELPGDFLARVVAVNSPSFLDKINGKYAPPEHTELTCYPIVSGLCLVGLADSEEVGDGEEVDDDVREAEIAKLRRLAVGSGATPSIHQMRKLARAPVEAPLSPDSLGNLTKLQALAGADGAGAPVRALRAVPKAHPLHAVTEATAKLVAGLGEAIQALPGDRTAELDRDILVDDALANMGLVTASMAASLHDSFAIGQLYEILVDDLFTILAEARPYQEKDFKAAAAKAFEARAPSVAPLLSNGCESQSFLMANGMDALGTALHAARTALGATDAYPLKETGVSANPNYYELGTVVQDAPQPGGILVGTLSPSSPISDPGNSAEGAWSADKLIAAVKTALQTAKPAILVLDTTIEKGIGGGKSELDTVVTALSAEIGRGDLLLVACKSYQKYLGLGTAKAMAGGVTILGRGSEMLKGTFDAMAKAEKALDAMATDEAQLVTHVMANAADLELEMLGKASANAEQANGLCRPEGGWSGFDEGLPFLMTGWDQGVTNARGKTIRLAEISSAMGMDARNSFAFYRTSVMEISESGGEHSRIKTRIALGQEPPGEIVEMLYAPGTFLGGTKPVDVAAIDRQVKADVAAAFGEFARKADLGAVVPQIRSLLRQLPGNSELSDKDVDDHIAKLKLARNKGWNEFWPGSVWADAGAQGAVAGMLACVSASVRPNRLSSSEALNRIERGEAVLTDTGSSMKTAPKEAPADPRTLHIEAMVTSCLRLASALGMAPDTLPEDEFERLEALHDALMATDLHGLGMEGRQRAIMTWMQFAKRRLKMLSEEIEKAGKGAADSERSRKKLVGSLVRNAIRLPRDAGRAELLSSLGKELDMLPMEDRDAATKILFGQLDLRSRDTLFKGRRSPQGTTRLSCAALMIKDLAEALPGEAPHQGQRLQQDKTNPPGALAKHEIEASHLKFAKIYIQGIGPGTFKAGDSPVPHVKAMFPLDQETEEARKFHLLLQAIQTFLVAKRDGNPEAEQIGETADDLASLNEYDFRLPGSDREVLIPLHNFLFDFRER